MTPLVSVWLPSYNHAPYLPAAIESVLGQTLTDVELVLVDDGSTDGSLEIARRYAADHSGRMTVLTHADHANLGVEASAQLAISHASGRFLLGHASDDVLFPDALEHCARLLTERAELGFVYGHAHLVDEHGRRLRERRTFGIDLTEDGRTLELLIQGNTIPSMTVMLRRECLEQTGPFDRRLVYSDWDLFARAAAHWDVAFIPRALAMHRVHGRNTSMQPPDVNRVRAIEVTAALRERAPDVGGRLAEPRMRALLELQMAFLRFASGEAGTGREHAHAAITRDPSLAADGRWIADWVWSRSFDGLLSAGCEQFARWMAVTAGPLLEPAARRELDRVAGAALRAERAARLAAERRPAATLRAALGAAVLSPRRAGDRRLWALLLDSAPRSIPARLIRRGKQLLRPRR